jgi:hypothetical protein
VGSVRLQLAVAKEVVFKLEHAQDTCALSHGETLLRSELKMKCLGLASLCRSVGRQRSRLMFLKDGDANIRFFHLQACHRNRKNMITHLMHNGVPIVDENLKAEVIVNHFDQIMGSVVQRSDGVNLDCIGLPRGQLPALDQFFSEDEMWNVIKSLPPYKAPDLDGFMGCFLGCLAGYQARLPPGIGGYLVPW